MSTESTATPEEAPENSSSSWLRRLAEQVEPGISLLIPALILGLLVGVLAGTFRLGLAEAIDLRHSLLDGVAATATPVWLVSAAVSASGVALAVWLVRRYAPEAAGSGIQEIEGALDDVRRVRWRRLIPVKFGGGLLAIGSGMIAGREGPTVQMGGALGRMLSDFLRLSPAQAHTLLAAGAGAGLTAAFNTPFAGILFVLEEMRPNFRNRVISLQALAIACVSSDLVIRWMLGGAPDITLEHFDAPHISSVWLFVLLGCLFGVLGPVFNSGVEKLLDGMARVKSPLVPAALIGAAIGVLEWVDPVLTGSGDRVIAATLSHDIVANVLLPVFLLRFVVTIVCFAAGSPGGIFAPMLALGTLLGVWFGTVSTELLPFSIPDPDVFAVVGMGALFAAVVRAPLTGIALAAGLTANYQLLWPLLATATSASIVAHQLGGQPIYTRLLERTLQRERKAAEDEARAQREEADERGEITDQ